MARILCVTGGLTGLLYSTIELARRLGIAGHDVVVAANTTVADTVQAHGLRFVPLEPDGCERAGDAAASGRLRRVWNVKRRRERAARAIGADAFIKTVRAVAPDVCLIDAEMHAHIIAASATGIPLALLVTFVSIWRCPGLPPPHHLVRPGVGWRGTAAGMSLLWLNLRLRKRRIAWWQRLRHLGCDRISVLRQLADNVGFDFRHDVDFTQWLIPFTYRHIPAFHTHAREFEFPHTPPDHVRYLGPLVLERRIDALDTAETRARLDAVFERRRRGGNARRLIYAGFGSFFSTDLAFVNRLFAAVAERPEWDLVLSLGGRTPPIDPGALPPNVCALQWVPQMEVLRHADVAVVHGGIGTADECVVAGVPMLVYCGFETDMGGTTARIWHHGLGTVGNRRRDSPRVIRERLDRILSQPELRDNVLRFRGRYAAYAEHRVAEGIIESLLAADRSTPDSPTPMTRPHGS